MSTKVLEIGYGSRPAFQEGSLFDDPAVNYVGLELPTSFAGSFVIESLRRDFAHVTGSMDAMPFGDESFDYVLMRSVYGQFKSQPSIITPVRMGIFECMRVLKPNGQIVISEENTPRDLEYISNEVSCAGFAIKAAQYMSRKNWEETPVDDPYRSLRSPFYDGAPSGAYGGWFGTPNIVIGSKPVDIKLRDVKREVVTNFYIPHDKREDWSLHTLTFKMPVKGEA